MTINPKHITWILLALILVVGGFLRFHGLEKESLWADELESWRISSVETVGEVVHECQRDVHPPAYQLLLWGWMKIAGDSPTALRLPSAFLGLLAVGLMFLLGRRWFSDTEGLIAAGLMAVTWFGVYYSQEARSYALMLVWTLLSFYTWREALAILKKQTAIPWKWLIAYIFIGAMGAYTHYFMLTVLLVQALVLGAALLGRWKELAIGVGIYVCMGLLFSPWLPSFFADLSTSAFWIPEPGWDFYFAFFRRAFFYGIIFAIPAGILVIMGFLNPLKPAESTEKPVSANRFLLLTWAILPFLIAFVKSKVGTPVLTYQNLIITLPALYLAAARGFTLIKLPKLVPHIAAAGFLLFALVYLIVPKHYFTKTEKMEYREAAQHVINHSPAPEQTLFLTYDYYPAYFGYYLREANIEPQGTGGELKNWPGILQMIRQSQKPNLWYMAGKLKPEPEFVAAMTAEAEHIDRFEFRDIEVYQLRLRATP